MRSSYSIETGQEGAEKSARVQMIVEWVVPLGQARAMTMALHSLMVEARTAPGCVGCSISTDLKDQGRVRYVEEWRAEEDLRKRLASSSFAMLAALIEDSTEPPTIEFTLPGGARGLDFVEEVRRTR